MSFVARCTPVLLLLMACREPVAPPDDTGSPDDAALEAGDATLPDDALDAGDSDAPVADDVPAALDAPPALLRFAVFGDVRPTDFDDTASYPTMVVGEVMDGVRLAGAQFAVGTGDYLFVNDRSDDAANAQLDLLLAAEQRFGAPVYHAMGNHECTTGSTSNCPLGNESAGLRAFRARLVPGRSAAYYDFAVPTPLGDAHFIMTAPNAWNDAQATWLTAALARPSTRYTFVVAHEPPTSTTIPPGTMPIETALAASTTPVTMRLYGHVHYYRHMGTNQLVVGNAGAPLSGSSAGAIYGFTVIAQRADGDVVITGYEVGSPATVRDTFVLHPDGTASH